MEKYRTEEGMKAKYQYINEYNKENNKMFSAMLKKDEYQELKELLQQKGYTNASFIRYALDKLRNGEI